ncbi:hypothetical protein MBM_03523 [Drepanopeziza brunnea f. sp. 'multigermtubi' MB_m1]|uniref:2EXR domain-containing protein n=1 Tax=Marssonina brunnea f. sp. multigermtubi (strain MB_m1) TaxID=1072389 RepID=K1WLD3_MARBU|nr:uncharacterized protein MBM_03523 [Drepanopeziza brunnea f. sp. 'multigermtubi' MB_m1]EKD18530.1 hypothetical protein MBM_03523 [Drepanopeziza brunnea f. sp. 'multigermtubi' MB_m1]
MSESAKAFPRFPELPLELRRMIWRDAVEQRIIETYWISGGFKFHAHPPPLLGTNRESRETVLDIYKSSHQHLWTNNDVDNGCYTCYDPDRDILYFPYKTQVDRFDIKHLAISLPPKDMEDKTIPELHSRSLNLDHFDEVQSRARRVANLQLETLTLVVGDPIMKALSDHTAQKPSVARCFREISESHRPAIDWAAGKDQIQQKLAMPHDPWYGPHGTYLAPLPSDLKPPCTWGSPKIQFRTVERNYTFTVRELSYERCFSSRSAVLATFG